jgi:hypothetical protein
MQAVRRRISSSGQRAYTYSCIRRTAGRTASAFALRRAAAMTAKYEDPYRQGVCGRSGRQFEAASELGRRSAGRVVGESWGERVRPPPREDPEAFGLLSAQSPAFR